jgi:ATP:ADP antiporter, AAA family
VSVTDPATIGLLEQTTASENPRQAAYALGLLGEAPGYNLRPLLGKLAQNPAVEVRTKVYELARVEHDPQLIDSALAELRGAGAAGSEPTVRAAAHYALIVSGDAQQLLRELLQSPNANIWDGAMDAVLDRRDLASEVITREWISAAAQDPVPERRALAARAIRAAGDQDTEALYRLLEDSDSRVITAACHTAGELRNRSYVHGIVRRLSDVGMRGVAIESLAAYGPMICGTLADALEDESAPLAVRRYIPRVLRLIVHQRSVDVLISALRQQNPAIRAAVLKALNRLRESKADLNYSDSFVTEQIHQEARYYFELNAALAPFRGQPKPSSAASLLARTIEERLRHTLERLFRLLGLRYPPTEIYSAYIAVNRQHGEQFSAALEFLDSVLERDLKRILLPLLDAPEHLLETGRHLYKIEPKTPEQAIRELIRSGDPWLVACAVAAAGELRLHQLTPEIQHAAENTGPDVAEVARSAVALLAA